MVKLPQGESHDRRVCWVRCFLDKIKLMANLQEKNPMKPRAVRSSCGTLYFFE